MARCRKIWISFHNMLTCKNITFDFIISFVWEHERTLVAYFPFFLPIRPSQYSPAEKIGLNWARTSCSRGSSSNPINPITIQIWFVVLDHCIVLCWTTRESPLNSPNAWIETPRLFLPSYPYGILRMMGDISSQSQFTANEAALFDGRSEVYMKRFGGVERIYVKFLIWV